MTDSGVPTLIRPSPAAPPGAAHPAPTSAKPGKVRFACPACGSTLQVAAESAGRKGKCPRCSRIIRLPANVRAAKAAPAEDAHSAPHVPPQLLPENALESLRQIWQQHRRKEHPYHLLALVIGVGSVVLAFLLFPGKIGTLASLGILTIGTILASALFDSVLTNKTKRRIRALAAGSGLSTRELCRMARSDESLATHNLLVLIDAGEAEKHAAEVKARKAEKHEAKVEARKRRGEEKQMAGICDLCNNTCTSGTVVAAKKMTSAARQGFCPSLARRMLGSVGLGPEGWQQDAISGATSQTDWLACGDCMRELRQYL